MRRITALIFTTLAFAFMNETQAQKFSGLDKSPHDITYYRTERNAPPLIKVVYGRPQKKERKIFGGIVAYDQIWRTGANEATEITFYKNVKFGNKNVKAGTYVLHTIPGEDQWTIILNSKLDVWGAYSYEENLDVARIKVPSKTDGKELEAFSIAFKQVDQGVHMVLGWDTTRVAIPISL